MTPEFARWSKYPPLVDGWWWVDRDEQGEVWCVQVVRQQVRWPDGLRQDVAELHGDCWWRGPFIAPRGPIHG